jgi:hypothetical protein
MKIQIRSLFIALAILTRIGQVHAVPVFPIATNANSIAVCGGIASGGTNYLAAYLSGTNICTQLFSTNGTLIGASVTNGHSQGLVFPNVASGTNYLVAWYDAFANTGDGQILSRTNGRVGSILSFAYTPIGAASDGTNYLVVLQDGNENLYGQFVNGGGTLSGSLFLINSQQEGNGGGTAGIIFGKTNYLVLDQGNYTGVPGESNVLTGAFVSRNGSVTGPFQISQIPSEDSDLNIPAAFDGTNFFVVWDWDPPPETEGTVTNWQVHGRLVSQTGALVGNEKILVSGPGNHSLSSIAFDGTNYLLSWTEGFAITNSPPKIRCQFFNRSASAVGIPFTPFAAQGTNVPLLAINGLVYNAGQYIVAATFGTLAFDDMLNFQGFPSAEVLGAFLSPSLAGSQVLSPPRFTSFQHNGSLTWTNTSGTNAFVLETASVITGPWFYAAAPLDLTVSTSTQTTVSIPFTPPRGFYLLQQGFSPQAFHGAWIAMQAGTTNVGNVYFMPDGNGTITNFGGFNLETPPGAYGMDGNGDVSFTINAAEDGVEAFSGLFSPPREITLTGAITNTASALFPVGNAALCSGAWSGTLTDTSGGGGPYAFTLAVATNGFANLSGSAIGTGWLFALAATNGAACGFLHTSASDPYDQVQLSGTLTGNTITGTYSVDNANDVEGTFTLTR